MKKPRLLLVGAGGHAQSCIDVVEQQNKYRVVGLVGLHDEVGSQVLGYKVLGTDDDFSDLQDRADFALITIGQIGVSEIRRTLFSKIIEIGFKSPTVISPLAYVSPYALIEGGTIVMHRATVNAGAKIGMNCIINSHALIEHDVVIEDHCHVSTSATINGGTVVGQSSFVGSSSTLRESISVGQLSTIGMCANVRENLPPNSRFTQD
jgi:sugar O-acyltransferase (sialic acid O-acetyltransferase NeuD family)